MSAQTLPSLNEHQRRAVTASLDRNILVLAGAGCGKTAVLIQRIGFLIENGILPDQIIAITFTRKASLEMQERLAKHSLFCDKTPLPLISTFHGFALKILLESIDSIPNFYRVGYGEQPKLLDQNLWLELLVRCSSVGQRRELCVDISGLDSLVQKYRCFPEKIEGSQPASVIAILQEIIKNVDREKRNMGLWDFSDLLDNVICLFSTDATLLSQYQKKFSMILVDEFQDTNPQQVKLLKLLLTTRSFIFAVGDDDQAIYGFRGADIRPILEFNNHFPNSQILKLEINYRSTPKILTLANRVSSDKIAGTPKVLVSGTYQKKSGVPPQIKKFSSESEMAQWIVRKVEEIGCDDNGPVNGIACLFRTNRTLAQLQNLITTAAKKILPQLQFITVHSAKGLEFDVVFICDLEASVFPASSVSSKKIGTWVDFFRSLKKKPSHDELLEEEKRLYYVAVTRARKHLFLLHAAQKENYGRTRSYQPSSFLNYSTVLGRLRVRRLF